MDKTAKKKVIRPSLKPKKSILSPEDAVQFLEDIRKMSGDINEHTVAISLRVPANVLRAIKLKAKAEGKKYQSLIVDYLRRGLAEIG